MQVENALNSAYGAAEEKRQKSRGRIKLKPRAEEARSSSTIRLRGGRRDVAVLVEEKTGPPSSTS
jgi:hypothetical protein